MSLAVTREGPAVVLTVDRPSARNALDRQTVLDLGRALEGAGADTSVRGVVLASTGDVFLAGGDLKELAARVEDPDGARFVLEYFDSFSRAMEIDVPVVAAVQGPAIGGGCEVLLLCDLVVMARSATMTFRHVRLGLTPAWGGTCHLLERAGPLGAARALFLAEALDAATCVEMGLASEIVDDGACLARAIEIVAACARSPRAAIAAAKRAIREVRAARRGPAWEVEREIFVARWGSPEHRAAMAAYRPKP